MLYLRHCRFSPLVWRHLTRAAFDKLQISRCGSYLYLELLIFFPYIWPSPFKKALSTTTKESILRAYVVWRTGSSNRVVVPARQAGNPFLGSLKGLQIRAQVTFSAFFIYFHFYRCRLCSVREDSERHLLGVGGGGIAPRVRAIGNHSYHHSATIWREKIRQTQWLTPTFKTCVIFKARWKWPDARRVKLFIFPWF